MVKKIQKLFFIATILIFTFLILQYYFSENNVIFTNKSRLSYSSNIENNISKLPLLKNNTNDIITFKNDIEEFNQKRKKRLWEKLISNTDE